VVTAIVLIKCDVARIPETAQTIAQMPAVSEVYSVTGEFDLVALVRVRAHEELGDVIPGSLNKVAGVTHTETHIAFRTYSRHDLEAAFALRLPRAGLTAPAPRSGSDCLVDRPDDPNCSGPLWLV
jgi:DNA-binding Lrp family transcriptional regulator